MLCVLVCAACCRGNESVAGGKAPAGAPCQRRWELPERVLAANSDFSRELREVGKSYREFTRRGGPPKWSPGLCTVPPPTPVLSTNNDEGAHGRKLYYLFVKDDASYESLGPGSLPQQSGQALVKESYFPCEVAKDDAGGWEMESKGKHYRRGQLYALFIMLKLDPTTPGTDQGWVYGTLTPDGEKVTSQGRVENCMSCHEDAPYERLFGPKSTAQTKGR
ncbi:hypothetical protein PLCT2_01600 [Planctomycetaceae bacterium]|nr:hypothetical protein PLCT2_01600 [Planctomycetaceae bacterium]